MDFDLYAVGTHLAPVDTSELHTHGPVEVHYHFGAMRDAGVEKAIYCYFERDPQGQLTFYVGQSIHGPAGRYGGMKSPMHGEKAVASTKVPKGSIVCIVSLESVGFSDDDRTFIEHYTAEGLRSKYGKRLLTKKTSGSNESALEAYKIETMKKLSAIYIEAIEDVINYLELQAKAGNRPAFTPRTRKANDSSSRPTGKPASKPSYRVKSTTERQPRKSKKAAERAALNSIRPLIEIPESGRSTSRSASQS